MIRFGLCCIFHDHPVKFRHISAANLVKLPEAERRRKLSSICLYNSFELEKALLTVDSLSIGAFRINSQILAYQIHTHKNP